MSREPFKDYINTLYFNRAFGSFASMHNPIMTAVSRRTLRFIIAFAISFILLLLILSPSQTYQRFTSNPVDTAPEIYKETLSQPKFPPPPYTSLRKWEENLPQHNLDLPFPEGKTGRYVKFSNQIIMLGFNNVLNEVSVHSCSHSSILIPVVF